MTEIQCTPCPAVKCRLPRMPWAFWLPMLPKKPYWMLYVLHRPGVPVFLFRTEPAAPIDKISQKETAFCLPAEKRFRCFFISLPFYSLYFLLFV